MLKSSFGSKLMPRSYFYDKYLQSYGFYCNSMQQRIFAGLDWFFLAVS